MIYFTWLTNFVYFKLIFQITKVHQILVSYVQYIPWTSRQLWIKSASQVTPKAF